MKKERKSTRPSEWEAVERLDGPALQGIDLRITVIIPTQNSAQRLDVTLQSLLQQEYPNLEVIVVDASSSDRTVAIVQAVKALRPRVYSVPDSNLYEMYNRGISLATGTYFCILFPGDFYVSNYTLQNMAQLITKEGGPDIAYCGCFLRETDVEPRTLLRPFSEEVLRKGQQPTSLQSCWFRTEVVKQIGRFRTTYRIRAGFDLLCRLNEESGHKVASVRRIYLDHEREQITYRFLLRRSWETFLILRHHYGWRTALVWFIAQNPFKILAWSWKGLRKSVTSQ